MSRPTSLSSTASIATAESFISQLDLQAIQQLALATRKAQVEREHLSTGLTEPAPSDWACNVITPPKIGGYNVVHFLEFSDGVSWVIRMPFNQWEDVHARSMQLDILALDYIISRTSLPIPRIHGYSCDTNNSLGHPYMLMDKVHGTRLIDVWNEPSWWIGERSKQRLFDSLAAMMVELSSLEFDKIGRLVRTGPSSGGAYYVGPFPPEWDSTTQKPTEATGPFSSAHTFLSHSISSMRRQEDSRELALLQLFLGALSDPRFDSAPFTFGHPDFDSQNIFVDDTGRVVGLIDWDGVSVLPRQLGALTYPAWITVDWDPTIYDGYRELPHYDTEEDLHAYREMYTQSIRAASDGRLHEITRNSHIAANLQLAIDNAFSRVGVLFRLGEFIFCNQTGTYRALRAIERSGWFTYPSDQVAEVIILDEDEVLVPEASPYQNEDSDERFSRSDDDDASNLEMQQDVAEQTNAGERDTE
ncbi:hypothetical protein PYCCODRAFT_1428562 [Trametes coccinea BRFM310]|uniref:Aminoglycoside phosphotransferase domain-containing protein n=1 Tax=Trametes coccinea (strain BRFM310) TaxID=1353009 RepID=A0A1Y2I883_TRAC3|nr:hypothetical protein PYCCODRAFT_1428562 [Trametes coccinea BRFM310]